jgi:hypothetical protein
VASVLMHSVSPKNLLWEMPVFEIKGRHQQAAIALFESLGFKAEAPLHEHVRDVDRLDQRGVLAAAQRLTTIFP